MPSNIAAPAQNIPIHVGNALPALYQNTHRTFLRKMPYPILLQHLALDFFVNYSHKDFPIVKFALRFQSEYAPLPLLSQQQAPDTVYDASMADP